MEPFKLSEKLLSLNGFEEIAVEKAFGQRIERLPETECVRAVIFTMLIREGTDRRDAHTQAMTKTMGEVQALILPEGDLDPGEQEIRDVEYADFVLGTGMSWLPDQYRQLTAGQRIAMVDAAKRQQKGH